MRLTDWALALIATASLAACGSSGQDIAAARTLADSADQVLVKVKANLATVAGLKRGEMTGDTAFVLHDATVLVFRSIHITFTSDSGFPVGTLTADRATLLQTRGILELSGDITLGSPGGRVVHAQRGRYTMGTNRIELDSGVKIGNGQAARSVKSLTADPALERCVPGC